MTEEKLSDLMSDMEAVASVSTPSDADTHKIQDLANQLLSARDAVTAAEQELRDAKDEFQRLSRRELPDLMDELNVDRQGLADQGVDIIVENFYKASIPSDNPELRQQAFDWLEENGFESLIRVTVEVRFPKANWENAQELRDQLIEMGHNPLLDMSVHWKTLTSWLKEQSEKSSDLVIPMEALGADVGRVAKIKERK